MCKCIENFQIVWKNFILKPYKFGKIANCLYFFYFSESKNLFQKPNPTTQNVLHRCENAMQNRRAVQNAIRNSGIVTGFQIVRTVQMSLPRVVSCYFNFSIVFLRTYFNHKIRSIIPISERTCLENEFVCKTGKCLPRGYLCDSQYDCGRLPNGDRDLSDEAPELCKSLKILFSWRFMSKLSRQSTTTLWLQRVRVFKIRTMRASLQILWW